MTKAAGSTKLSSRLDRAKQYLAIAEAGDSRHEAYRLAAEEIAAYKQESGETAANLARLIGRKPDYVQKLLQWSKSGYAAPTPFLMDALATTRAATSHTRKVLREDPVSVAKEIADALQDPKVARAVVDVAPDIVPRAVNQAHTDRLMDPVRQAQIAERVEASRAERRARSGFMELVGEMINARKAIRQAAQWARDAIMTDEERELVGEDLDKLIEMIQDVQFTVLQPPAKADWNAVLTKWAEEGQA